MGLDQVAVARLLLQGTCTSNADTRYSEAITPCTCYAFVQNSEMKESTSTPILCFRTGTNRRPNNASLIPLDITLSSFPIPEVLYLNEAPFVGIEL
jgi:hypothetical protein